MASKPTADVPATTARSIIDLPADELRRYAAEIGVEVESSAPREEVAREIRKRQELLVELGRDALLELVVWGRRPVRQDADKEELARQIARIQGTRYKELSIDALRALAQLRGIPGARTGDAERLIDRLKKRDGLWKRIASRRRSWVGSLVSRMIEGKPESDEYQFLPADTKPADKSKASIKGDVEQHGLVGGLAQRLRGAADDYIRVKLDEIETRIDEKLDEIDRRLSEWRDREVANRLRILRITLIFTVVVALLSLGYNYMKKQVTADPPAPAQTTQSPHLP